MFNKKKKKKKTPGHDPVMGSPWSLRTTRLWVEMLGLAMIDRRIDQ